MGNPKVTAFFHFQPALVHDPSGHPAGRLCQKVPKGAKVKTVDRRPTKRTSAIFLGGSHGIRKGGSHVNEGGD